MVEEETVIMVPVAEVKEKSGKMLAAVVEVAKIEPKDGEDVPTKLPLASKLAMEFLLADVS